MARFQAATPGPDERVYFAAPTVQPDNRRIMREAEVVNVIYELPGAMPGARARLYYVLAHLDSRCLDPTDATTDAPGANDDASGVALLIELARVLAPMDLDATVVLVATSGEEQGLYGASLHEDAATASGLDIRAGLNNPARITLAEPTEPD